MALQQTLSGTLGLELCGAMSDFWRLSRQTAATLLWVLVGQNFVLKEFGSKLAVELHGIELLSVDRGLYNSGGWESCAFRG